MLDPRIEKLADVLVNYSVAVQPGDRVMVQGDAPAEPLLKAVYAKVLQAGGHPLILVTLPNIDEVLFRYASDEQLQHVPEPFKLVIGTYDVRIGIVAAENTKTLSAVDPARMALRNEAYGELMRIFLRRSASGEVRWTDTLFPTNAYAQDAEMSLDEYEDFVYRACFCDQEDPIACWQEIHGTQQRLVDWLKAKQEVRVTSPDADLTLSIEGRVFINSDGHHNMPSGEIFTGPVEDSVEGHVYFSYPAIYRGREVRGVKLWFKEGQVVKASAEKNEDLLLNTLAIDPGARRVGEFAIGTNKGISRFTRQILFDEKINGSFHIALGAGFPETGSKNESAIHWDMISDLRHKGEIWVDNELLYKNGRFVIGL